MSDFYTNMKILFCLLLFITQCEQPKTSESHINFDVSGNYHWKSDKRSNYDRDNYMILTKKGDKIKGYYYGNSDEFSLSPHGLWPGYFVLEMQDLTFHEDSIKFKLKPRSNDFFNEPVKFSFFTSEDALKDGNTKWNFIENFQFNPVKEYIGVFSDSTTIWLDKDAFHPEEDRQFNKQTKLQSIGNLAYQEYFRSQIQTKLSTVKSKVAILPFEALTLEWLKENKKPDIKPLEARDIQLITELLKKSIDDYNSSTDNKSMRGKIVNYENNYITQIVSYLNPAKEREAYVNCVCLNGVDSDWRKKLIIVEGGGSCFFRIFINLDKKTAYNFWVNFSY